MRQCQELIAAVSQPFGTRSFSSRSAFRSSAVAGMRPSLAATRWPCVSTGRTGRARVLKQRTEALIFGPTPGRLSSHALASGIGGWPRKSRSSEPRRSMTALSDACTNRALSSGHVVRDRMSARRGVGARRASSQLSNRRTSTTNAAPESSSFVRQDIRDRTIWLSGSSRRLGGRSPWAARSRLMIPSIGPSNRGSVPVMRHDRTKQEHIGRV